MFVSPKSRGQRNATPFLRYKDSHWNIDHFHEQKQSCLLLGCKLVRTEIGDGSDRNVLMWCGLVTGVFLVFSMCDDKWSAFRFFSSTNNHRWSNMACWRKTDLVLRLSQLQRPTSLMFSGPINPIFPSLYPMKSTKNKSSHIITIFPRFLPHFPTFLTGCSPVLSGFCGGF